MSLPIAARVNDGRMISLGPTYPGQLMLRRSPAVHRPHGRYASPLSLNPRRPSIHWAHAPLSFVLTLLIFLATAAAQTTIHIPADQPTIQAGINAASNGDTVLVAPGTYYENIDFKGKAITVTSFAGPATTIIDGGNKDGVATVIFSKGETSTSVISKFTIRGGGNTIFAGTSDGGVYVGGASPTIRDNTVTANYCHNIDVEFGAATILNNEISGVLQSSQGTNYCTFGSGVHLQGTPNGSVPGSSIVGNTIENNLTGSGINLWAAQNVLILNNTIRNNTSHDPGSALTSANSNNTVLVQNLIYGNTSNCGGALGFMGSIFAANNTIVDNVFATPTYGSECTAIAQIYPGPYEYGGSFPSAVFINNIFSGSTSYPAVNCSWFGPPSEAIQPTFENNILYNAGGPFFGSFCVDVSGKYNNITSDPQFVSPSTGDYHLKSTSPAIDTGQNNALQTFLAMAGQTLSKDFDGNPRVQDATAKGCVIDMGAYEYPGALSNCGVSETLTSSLNPATVGQSVTFTAQLGSATGIPTGVIQFLDGTNILSTQVVSGTGSSTFSASSLAVGSHTITANYQPTGSFGASTASLTQVINGYTTGTTLTCLPSPIAVFNTALLAVTVTSTNGTPTGSIAFTDNGAALATQGLLNGATSFTYTGLIAETHNITATYTPTGSFATSSATCSEVVTPLPTTSVLIVTPSTSTYGSPVTLSATVSPTTLPGPSTPTGVVTFYDGATSIAVVPLDAFGHALTTATLAAGTHTLTAMYSGSTIYSPSTSLPFTETIKALPQDFTITLASPTVTIQTQHHLTTTVTLTSLNGFADTLALTCANIPTYVTCRPTPNPAPLATNASTTVSLYLDTDSVLGYARLSTAPPPNTSPASPINLALLFAPISLLTGLAAYSRRRTTRLRLLVLLFALIPASLALTGCGEIIYPYEIPPSAAPGTYTIPITATGASTGLTHTANLTLQITP